MKRKFTLLIAALALLTMIVQPGRAWGQARADVEISWTASEQGYTNGQDVGNITIDDHISGTFAKNSGSNGPKYYTSGTSVRMYSSNSLTITPDENSTITEIIFTLSQSGGFTVSTGDYSVDGSTGTWSGSSTGSIVFTNGSSQNRIQVISVTYTYSGTPTTTHTLTFSADPAAGGTVTVGTSTSGSIDLAEAATVSVSATANTGYEFDGWTVSGTGSSVEDNNEASTTFTMGTADATLTASFTEVTTYTVTYKANGPDAADVVDTYNSGATVTVRAANTFSYAGHAFTEWNTDEEGDGDSYDAGETFSITGNVILYAQWVESSEATATLNIQSYGTDHNWVSGTQYTSVTIDQVTFEAGYTGTYNNTGKYYSTVTPHEWRYYQSESATITISVPTGYHLVSITPTYASDKGGILLNGSATIQSGSTVDVSGTSVTFSVGNSGTATNGQVKFTNIVVNYESEGGTPAPSYTITNNDELTYNATNGSFNFTVNNPVEGGVTTVTEEVDWISEAVISEGSVTFNTTTNTNSSFREGTITLTYTYEGGDPVVQNVTITQAGDPSVIDPISSITSVGTFYRVQGTVVATNSRGFVMGDGTGYVYYYNNGAVTQSVEDMVKVSGTTDTYGHIIQFTNAATVTEATTSNYNNTPTATGITSIPDYTEGYHLSTYLEFEGLLTTSEEKYFITLGEGQIQISYPTDAQVASLEDLLNKTVHVKGYFSGINSSEYFTVMLESVEEAVVPTITATPSPFTAPPYVVGTAEPEFEVLTVNGINLTANIALNLNTESSFEMYDEDNDEWVSTLSLVPTDGNVTDAVVAIRLKAGQEIDNYEGSVTLSSTGATNVMVALSGSVTGAPHSITSFASHGTINFAPASSILAGTEVTMTAVADEGYVFVENSWVFYDGDLEPVSISVEGNKFTMPDYDLVVDATFLSTTFEGLFEPFTGDIVEGDYVIYGGTNGAMKNVVTSNRFENQNVDFDESNISNPNIAAVWHIAQISGTDFWSIYNVAADKYAGGTNSKNQGALYDDTEDDLAKWTIEYDNGYTFENHGRTLASSNSENAYLRQNGSSGWATYIVSTGNAPQLYKLKQPVAPTWSDQFPTEANLITGQEYELTVSDYVSGYPTPTITLVTDASTDDYDFDDGLLVYTPSATGTFTFTFTATNAAGSSDGVLTITVTEPAPVNYYYSENGVLGGAQTTTQGSSIELADAEDLNEDFVFVGWTTNANDVENILDAGSSQTINAETTFYAVYSNTVSVTETKVVILDGSGLTSTATTDDYEYTNNNFKYTLSEGAKQQTSNGENRFADKAILIGKTGAYIYNQDAYGQGITRFEVYANSGASASVSVGINFSTSTIDKYDAEATNTWAETLSTRDHVYDASLALPEGAKYFWYQVTNSNNSQIQFRITYTETTSVTTKYTLVQEYSGEQSITTVTPTDLITVPSGAVLTITGDCTGTADNLIIEDGGQVIVNNVSVQATYIKSVSHSTKDADNWYTISSPVNSIAPSAVTNLIQVPANNYDLYYYDEAAMYWRNFKQTAFANLTNGKGYLYWNDGGDELSFPGELNSGDIEIALTKTGDGNLAGWNLIGNPYSHNIYKGNGTAIVNSVSEGYGLTTGFYTLANSGAWVPGTDNTTAIVPGQGILVKATTEGTLKMTNTNSSGTAKANNDNIQFIVSNSEYQDIAYALFDTGIGLDKINHRNADIPMLYIPQNDKNYAIATMDDNTQAFNLNFKAMTTGQYTLSFKAQGSYSYLHVIDRITGEDIDMLLDGEYTFIGSPRDNENRFIVKLNYNANIDELEAGDSFAYQYGNGIIVNGKGELQVFDVNGRMVMNTVINGKQTVNIPTTGLYIFRMVGESVKTQKIVVR